MVLQERLRFRAALPASSASTPSAGPYPGGGPFFFHRALSFDFIRDRDRPYLPRSLLVRRFLGSARSWESICPQRHGYGEPALLAVGWILFAVSATIFSSEAEGQAVESHRPVSLRMVWAPARKLERFKPFDSAKASAGRFPLPFPAPTRSSYAEGGRPTTFSRPPPSPCGPTDPWVARRAWAREDDAGEH